MAWMGERDIDQTLVERVQKGDKRAFDLLVLKYQYKIASVIALHVKNHQEVSDLVQETFIKAYKSLGQFREDSAFYTWLYRIGVNTAKNHIVAMQRRVPDVDIDIDELDATDPNMITEGSESPENLVMGDELRDAVLGSIDKLPLDLKAAIMMREFEGKSYSDIAGIMHCPVGTVRSRIHRAREAIDHTLGPTS